MYQEKRRLRQLKRQLKNAGNRTRRRALQRDLDERPEEAHWSEQQLGRHRSRELNGMDRDSTKH
jgi:hypothetical protein